MPSINGCTFSEYINQYINMLIIFIIHLWEGIVKKYEEIKIIVL